MSSEETPSSAPEEHRKTAPKAVACVVLTVSDTRGEAEDRSGRLILDALERAGHELVFYRIEKDEPDQIREALFEAARLRESGRALHAILINGGTGISSRDRTHETVVSLIEKRLDGFGELFRMLSYEEIGAAAMLSRAIAGTFRGMAVFSMPGSTGAVKLAMEKLILPELPHIARELAR